MKLTTLPIIMVTAERDKQEVMKALAEKASGYIVKPFQREVVLRQIGGAMERWVAEKSAGKPTPEELPEDSEDPPLGSPEGLKHTA